MANGMRLNDGVGGAHTAMAHTMKAAMAYPCFQCGKMGHWKGDPACEMKPAGPRTAAQWIGDNTPTDLTGWEEMHGSRARA